MSGAVTSICSPRSAECKVDRLLHALSMWPGERHLTHILPRAMHNVPNRFCASNPHEVHLPVGGQQLMSFSVFRLYVGRGNCNVVFLIAFCSCRSCLHDR